MIRQSVSRTSIVMLRRATLMALMAGAALLTCLPAAEANPAGALPRVTHQGMTLTPVQYGQRFNHPQIRGAAVDWCAVWASECGAAGANLYCEEMGFHSATGWNTFSTGRTYVIGSEEFCTGSNCRGFSYVTCE